MEDTPTDEEDKSQAFVNAIAAKFREAFAMLAVQNIAISTQTTTIAVLERDVRELKSQNEQLEARLAKLERTMGH